MFPAVLNCSYCVAKPEQPRKAKTDQNAKSCTVHGGKETIKSLFNDKRLVRCSVREGSEANEPGKGCTAKAGHKKELPKRLTLRKRIIVDDLPTKDNCQMLTKNFL